MFDHFGGGYFLHGLFVVLMFCCCCRHVFFHFHMNGSLYGCWCFVSITISSVSINMITCPAIMSVLVVLFFLLYLTVPCLPFHALSPWCCSLSRRVLPTTPPCPTLASPSYLTMPCLPRHAHPLICLGVVVGVALSHSIVPRLPRHRIMLAFLLLFLFTTHHHHITPYLPLLFAAPTT